MDSISYIQTNGRATKLQGSLSRADEESVLHHLALLAPETVTGEVIRFITFAGESQPRLFYVTKISETQLLALVLDQGASFLQARKLAKTYLPKSTEAAEEPGEVPTLDEILSSLETPRFAAKPASGWTATGTTDPIPQNPEQGD